MTNYLADFRKYLMARTDAPQEFHTMAGLATLAVAIGTHCWVDGAAREVYPNLNIVCLAPSGMGKSVPLDMAANIIRKAEMGDCLLPASFSQEALLSRLASQPIGLWVIQEFSAFQALLGREYNSGAEQTLTELYDVPDVFERSVLKSQSYTLRHPCITILGASSPDWFAQAFKGSALRGGWLARFLFCPSRDGGTPIGDPGPRDHSVENGLAWHLKQVEQLRGRFDTSVTRSLHEDFSRECRMAARESTDFGGMRSRAPTVAQKIAMLLHVSRDPTSTALDVIDMEKAIQFTTQTIAAAEFYLEHEVAVDRADSDRRRLVDKIKERGGTMQRSALLKSSHMSKRAFDEALATLMESGQVERDKTGRAETYMLPSAKLPISARGTFGKLGNFQNGSISGNGALATARG